VHIGRQQRQTIVIRCRQHYILNVHVPNVSFLFADICVEKHDDCTASNVRMHTMIVYDTLFAVYFSGHYRLRWPIVGLYKVCNKYAVLVKGLTKASAVKACLKVRGAL
jgi:hypothetical protein